MLYIRDVFPQFVLIENTEPDSEQYPLNWVRLSTIRCIRMNTDVVRLSFIDRKTPSMNLDRARSEPMLARLMADMNGWDGIYDSEDLATAINPARSWRERIAAALVDPSLQKG